MIKQLKRSIRQYKKASILTPLLVSGEVVLEVLIPLAMAKLIDLGIDAENPSMVWKIGILMLLMCALSLTLGALSGRYAAIASTGFARNLRHDLYYKVQDFAFSNIDKFSTGGIVTRLTTDVTNVQNAYMMIIRVAVRCPVMLILSLCMAASINAKLSLIFLGAAPILAIGLYFIMQNAFPLFQRTFRTYDKLNDLVQENLLGIRVVKGFVREDHEIEKFQHTSKEIFQNFSKAERILAFNAPLMQACIYGCMLLLAWLGAKAVVVGTLSTGELMSFFIYTMQILMSLMMLSMVFVMIAIARTSAERICAVLKEESDIQEKEDCVTEVKDGSVEFRHVNFSYSGDEEKLCLKDANLTIQAGETVGVLGGTGSAKTTLVQLIPRLYDVTSGELLVGGVDVRDYSLETLRNAVAMVLQKNVLFSGTIADNLRWGKADATDEEMRHVCALAQADSFIEGFPKQYDTWIEQGGSNVSGGQKQRLTIARALLKSPKILILDDSTSAVDTATDSKIRAAFRDLLPDVTKIIIAQRISSVMDADKIILMENGRILNVGKHEELMEKEPMYREIYEAQSQLKGGGDYDAE